MSRQSLSWLVVICGVLLSLLSLTMLASIAPSRLLLQVIYSLAAVLLSVGVWRVGIVNWLIVARPMYAFVLLLLVATVLFGRVTRGSSRWLELGGWRLQTSELSKPIMLLTGATLLTSAWPVGRTKQLIRTIKYILITSPAIVLVLLQPDLGTAIILAIIALTVLFYSGIPRWLAWSVCIIAVASMPLLSRFLEPYQVRRLQTFIDPYSDPQGGGYNAIQSIIAVGSGQILGRGLGHGTQSHLQFLPERQTDFIFASLVEELGLIGGLVVISLYSMMFYGLVKLSFQVKNQQSFYILTGVSSWFFFQTGINLGMNLGLLPVTGITLPFLSAGGSSLVVSAVTLALAASAAGQERV